MLIGFGKVECDTWELKSNLVQSDLNTSQVPLQRSPISHATTSLVSYALFSYCGIFNVQLQCAMLLDFAGVKYSAITVYIMCCFNGPRSWTLLGNIVCGSIAAPWSYVVF